MTTCSTSFQELTTTKQYVRVFPSSDKKFFLFFLISHLQLERLTMLSSSMYVLRDRVCVELADAYSWELYQRN